LKKKNRICALYSIIKTVKGGKHLTARKEKKMEIMESVGMTDNQYKDFVEGIKEDLEELNEYKVANDEERYNKKYNRLMDRLEKALKR